MRVKVVHLITRLDLGGAQQNTLHTVRTLDRARFDPLLVCGAGGLLDPEVRADAAVRARFVSSLVREISPLKDLLAFLELTGILLQERPAVLHTHSSKAGILGRLAGALAGVPVVIHTFHGFGFHDRQAPATKGVFVALERLCARLSTALVFVSRSNIAYAAEHGLVHPEDAVLIRSGVALAGFPAPVDRKALRASIGVGPHKLLVVGVGNLKPQKNPDDLLAAAAEVCAKVPEARFAVIGDGPRRHALEARAFALGLEGKFMFLGWRRDAAQWLAAADAFALSSLWEGLPRALVEAMKTGLPCACYAADGVTDLLRDGETGLLVPAGDRAALAAALTRLLTDAPLRERLGKAAAAAVGPEFDIDGMVRAQEDLYARLLARTRRA